MGGELNGASWRMLSVVARKLPLFLKLVLLYVYMFSLIHHIKEQYVIHEEIRSKALVVGKIELKICTIYQQCKRIFEKKRGAQIIK